MNKKMQNWSKMKESLNGLVILTLNVVSDLIYAVTANVLTALVSPSINSQSTRVSAFL